MRNEITLATLVQLAAQSPALSDVLDFEGPEMSQTSQESYTLFPAIPTPRFATSQERPYRDTIPSAPKKLDKCTPYTLSHPGRAYHMRMHGKDNRN